jgi:sigma-B regulation protein RsbQ
MNVLERNNVRILGKGNKVMMLLHGYGCDQNMWSKIWPAFEDEYKLVLFDHVGSGQSNWDEYNYEKYSKLQGYADDLVEICSFLRIKDAVLVLHSVSAMIGMLAAIKAPSYFSKLIMICPSPCYVNDPPYYGGFERQEIEEMLGSLDKNFLGWSSHITPVVAGPGQEDVAEALHLSFCRHRPDIAKNFAKTTFLSDNRNELKSLKTPTLIIQCANDVIAPTPVGRYIHEQVLNSGFALLPVTGHSPHLSHPTLTEKAIKAYLRQ